MGPFWTLISGNGPHVLQDQAVSLLDSYSSNSKQCAVPFVPLDLSIFRVSYKLYALLQHLWVKIKILLTKNAGLNYHGFAY